MTSAHLHDQYVRAILASVDDDIADGVIPAGVRSYADLHDYVDANDYFDKTDMPYDDTPDCHDAIAAVQDAVSRALAAPERPFCTHRTCGYLLHEHSTARGTHGEDLTAAVPMRCHDCGRPAHFDYKIGAFRHDRPDTPNCTLIHQEAGRAGDIILLPAQPGSPGLPLRAKPRDWSPLPANLTAARAEAEHRTGQYGYHDLARHAFATYRWAATTRVITTVTGAVAAGQGELVLAGHRGAHTSTFYSARAAALVQVRTTDLATVRT